MSTKAVWKYEVALGEDTQIAMPFGARPLTFRIQGDRLCMWALVEPDASPFPYVFRVVGTGHESEGLFSDNYVGTVEDGPFIWHLFDVTNIRVPA